MVHISAFNDVNKASFRLPFSPITRGGATKFSKRKVDLTAHPFDAWRAKNAGMSACEEGVSVRSDPESTWRLPVGCVKFADLLFLRMQVYSQ